MSLSTHQRLVRAAREVSRAVRAVSAAERYMDGATLEFPRAYLKQLAAEPWQGSGTTDARSHATTGRLGPMRCGFNCA